MLSFAKDVLHTLSGGIFEDDEPPRRPLYPRYGVGPCHHHPEVECGNCRPPPTRLEQMHRCEKCGGYFSAPLFVEHYPRCLPKE